MIKTAPDTILIARKAPSMMLSPLNSKRANAQAAGITATKLSKVTELAMKNELKMQAVMKPQILPKQNITNL